MAALLFSFCKVGNGVIYHLSNVRKVRINQNEPRVTISSKSSKDELIDLKVHGTRFLCYLVLLSAPPQLRTRHYQERKSRGRRQNLSRDQTKTDQD